MNCCARTNWIGKLVLTFLVDAYLHSFHQFFFLYVHTFLTDIWVCVCVCTCICICSFWCIFHTHSHPFPQFFFLYHTFPTATSIYCPENSIPLNLSFYFELFFDKDPKEIYFGHSSLSLNRQSKFSMWVDINIKMLMFPFFEKHHTRQMPVIKSSHKKGLMYHT